MEHSPTPAPSPAEEPKTRRGCLPFFLKSTLGCIAFAIGSLIVLVLLLPTLCSSFAASVIESQFHKQFRGSLEVGEVELSWRNPQIVRDAVLRTPEKSEVARVTLTLPSLLDFINSNHLKIQLNVNADLVADDAGVTNLERALAPVEPAKKEAPSSDRSVELSTRIENLDVEIAIASQRLTWSDVETRRLGAPFEVRDLTAELAARPSQPIVARAHGTVVSDSPGELALDATLHDLLKKDQKWPWGRLDMKLSIKGFSSAMVDGIANQHGRLKEILGPRFDLTVDAKGATPDAGDVSLAFDSETAKARFAGRFEGGAFHLSDAPDQGITIPLPQSYIETFVTPHLPAGSKLVFGARPDQAARATQLWTLQVKKLELAIPDLAARDAKALQPYLERLACEAVIDLPADIGLQSPSVPTENGTPTLRRTRLGFRVAPSEPAVVGLSAELDMNGKASVGAEITLREPWKALAAGSMPRADAHLEVTGFSTATLDALAGLGGKLPGALGPKISVRVRAQDVSRDSGSFSLEVGSEHFELACGGRLEQGRILWSGTDGLTVRAEPPPAWLNAELAAHLPPGTEVEVLPGPIKLDARDVTYILPTGPIAAGPAGPAGPAGDALGLQRRALFGQLSCELPALRISNEKTRAAKIPIELGAARLALKLAESGELTLALKAAIDTGQKGTVSVAASVADAAQLATPGGLSHFPPIDAKLTLDGLSTAALERLAGQENVAVDLVGPNLSATCEVRGATLNAGTVRLDVTAQRLKLAFAGKFEGGALRCTGSDGLDLEVSPSGEMVASKLAALSPDARIAFPEASASASDAKKPIRLSLRDAVLPLTDFNANAKSEKPDIIALMQRASGRLRLEIDRLVYSVARPSATKVDVALDALAVNVDLAPMKPLAITMSAGIEAGGTGAKGALKAELEVKDPWVALKTEPFTLPPLDAQFEIKGLPSASIDALAGGNDLYAKLFGPTIEVTAGANAKGIAEGAFRLDVKSPTTVLAASGRLEKGALVCSGKEGFDLSIHLPPGWLEEEISPFLPAGARLSTPSDAAPLTAVVRDVRIELPTADPSAKPATAAASASTGEKSLADTANSGTAASKRAKLAMISKLALRAHLTVPTLTYSDAKTDAAVQPIAIRDLAAAIDLVPGTPPSLTLKAMIAGETGGDLNVSLRALDPLEKLSEEKGADTFRVAIDIAASRVPTAIVDALAGQDGLLVDALGPRLEMTVKSAGISRDEGAFVASLQSDQHSMHLVEGHFEHGDLVIDKDGGLQAKVGLTPLVSQRVVGNLVPMLVDVEKPAGSEPASFSVDKLRWPKDGDLGRVDADVRVNLGEVSYRLLPGLEAVFGASLPKSVKLPELHVPIQHGVASYTGLPIRIGGRDFVFKGTFNLKDKSFNLGTDVPLSLLGKNVEKQLDSLRGILSPDTLVPIEIRGTWKNPKIGIGRDFLKNVVEDAAKKELPGLLDGLLKKKNKKE